MIEHGVEKGGGGWVLVDFLDGRASGSGARWRRARSSGHAAGTLVQLGDDRIADGLDLLLLVLELVLLGGLVALQPLDHLLALVFDLLAVISRDLVLQLELRGNT